MRPLELRLAHFGPYRDEAVLDFQALDRLFLVCGPTGAGKTTLFDALTYALYEKTAGTRGGLSDQLASHHAPEGAVPEVSLRFSLGTQEWKVTRQLRHLAPKKNGAGWTTQEPRAMLEKKEGEFWVNQPGKRSELNQRLESLIGLSAEEFAKIVVLPQGDFQRFLEASTGDRERMLQKLFPVDHYDRFVETLKIRSRSVEEARKRWEDRWQELTGRLGPGADNRPELESALAEASAALRAAAEEEEAASAALVGLRALHADWTTLLAKREQQLRLEARRPRVEADREALLRAKKARPLGTDLDRQQAILTDGKRLRAEQDGFKQDLLTVTEALSALDLKAETRGVRETRLAEVIKERAVAELRLGQWKEGLELRRQEAQAREALDKITAAWNQAREAVARAEGLLTPLPPGRDWPEALAEVDAARACLKRAQLEGEWKLATSEAQGAEARAREAEAEATLWSQLVGALEAAALAETLVSGAPCPVCGSTEHPHVAQWPQASSEAPTRLAKARQVQEQARARWAVAEARRDDLAKQLVPVPTGGEALGIEGAAKRLASAEARVTALQGWTKAQEQARGTIATASANLAVVDLQRQDATRAWEPLSLRVRSLAEEVPQDPGPQVARLVAEESQLKQALETERREAEALGKNQQSLLTRIDAHERQLEVQRKEYQGLQLVLETAVRELGWTLEDLKSSRRTEPETALLEATVSTYDQEVHRLEGERQTLEARLPAGEPAPLTQAEERHEGARRARAQADTAAKEREFALRERDRLEDELREVGRQKAAIETEFQKLVPLARALEGNNVLNLKLTTWVLVQALEQVAQSASHRLASMSGGRYALKVQSRGSDARKDWGLDLAVIDGYTGQERAVGTLSGGEKFMTSISLALGLADVIQERSGGLKLEAIFIDEGFGTLDDQSLDRAMAILHDLGQHRSVGIISHVAELRQRISSRVEVIKGKNGSKLVQ